MIFKSIEENNKSRTIEQGDSCQLLHIINLIVSIIWINRLWTAALGSWACTVSSKLDFKFSFVPPCISIAVPTSYNEELHSLYRSSNIVRVIKSRKLRWAGHVARMEEGRSAFKILTGKPTGKRPLRRPRRRWEDNISMDLEAPGSISHGVS